MMMHDNDEFEPINDLEPEDETRIGDDFDDEGVGRIEVEDEEDEFDDDLDDDDLDEEDEFDDDETDLDDSDEGDEPQPTDSVFSDDWPEDHRSGVVAVIGRPNVGKSTLMNAILGQKVAITTPKPQTTRRQQLGIYTIEKGQMLLTDTPGIHRPHNKLSEMMYALAQMAIADADVILWILDASESPTAADEHIAKVIMEQAPYTPVVLALNKSDLVTGKNDTAPHRALIEHESAFEISALHNTNVTDIVEHLLSLLPVGPRYYPEDQVSDLNMRFIAAEMIREQIMNHTDKEVPHSSAVVIDSYREGGERTSIDATIYVERDSQKGIVIGKNGSMIKTIGSAARQELMNMLERPVHLELHVKVLRDWRSNEDFMKRLGYRLPRHNEAD